MQVDLHNNVVDNIEDNLDVVRVCAHCVMLVELARRAIVDSKGLFVQSKDKLFARLHHTKCVCMFVWSE